MELHGKYGFLAEGVRVSLAKKVITKFELSNLSDHQKFGLGMKEVWVQEEFMSWIIKGKYLSF